MKLNVVMNLLEKNITKIMISKWLYSICIMTLGFLDTISMDCKRHHIINVLLIQDSLFLRFVFIFLYDEP